MAPEAPIRVIVTGATGMVGEGVLLECLDNPAVAHVLTVSRKPTGRTHPKLEELLVPDFMKLDGLSERLTGYDGCFFCAGTSSVGMTEADYRHVTYDIPLHFAETVVRLNPKMVFDYVSGASTDGTEKGRIMWARVKGQAENALMRLPFRQVYAFRPGLMKPMPGQQHVIRYYWLVGWMFPFLRVVFPNHVSTLRQVALAMIQSVIGSYPKQVLEVADIKALAAAGEKSAAS